MHNHIVLLKENILKEIDDFCEIKEEIKSPRENMIVKVERKSSNAMYHALNETNNEHSRISFLKNDRFPDSIFISVETDGNISCHICELKRTPSNKLKELTEQLFSGYMHCKLLMSALHVNPSKINFKYHVFLINERNMEIEYNRLPKRPKKIIPGRRLEKESRYDMWMNNHLTFNDGKFSHRMAIEKHKYYENKESEYYYRFTL